MGRDTNQHDLLRMLEQRGIVTDHVADVFHMLRRAGNRAAHDFVGTHQDALNALRIAHDLAGWFHRTFGNKHARSTWKASPYVPPPDPAARLRSLEEAAASARTEAEGDSAD